MPVTVGPGVLLAKTALNILADIIGTLTTAIGTDHLATSSLITFSALEECWNFSSIRENGGDLVHAFFSDFQSFGVVLVIFKCQDSRSVCTACSITDRATILQTSGALQIAGVPSFTSVGVSWLRISLVVLTRPMVQGSAEKEFLNMSGFVFENMKRRNSQDQVDTNCYRQSWEFLLD